jgi:pimeloyl-ACP methyl ester carboxylesterase
VVEAHWPPLVFWPKVAATWFDTVKAPEKQLVWFEHSGHIPMTEEPGKFLVSLALRPADRGEGGRPGFVNPEFLDVDSQ